MLVANLSTETWQARREWHEIFTVLISKNMQPRILYPARLSFRIEGEIKTFPNKQKLKSLLSLKHLAGNPKGDSWVQSNKDHKGPETSSEAQDLHITQMALNTYLSIIILNVNKQNAPIKRHRVSEWIRNKKTSPFICCPRETHFRLKDTCRLKVMGCRTIMLLEVKRKLE